MRGITRREFLKSLAGLGLCALGGRALLAHARKAGSRPASQGQPNAHAREARYYVGIEESLQCRSCHTGAQEPSRVLYCHETDPHTGSHVKCQLCPRGCIISEGQRGNCRVRENRGGVLYTLAYGNPCAVHNVPIEIKPFYHFLPGSMAFSIATAGCNLHCLYCQNWAISQVPPEQTENHDLPPEAVVKSALQMDSQSLSYTYSEPMAFYEYMLDTARLGRAAGLRNTVVSNGYINPAPLRELCRTVDAIKIDLKGFREEFYRKVCSGTLGPVLEAIKIIRQEGVHLEMVNLVVPTLNDGEEELREMACWVVENLGSDVPIHFNRFFPRYKLLNLPSTPVETLERARAIAVEEGINYVYIGNVPGHWASHTYCARCGEAIIVRQGHAVLANHVVAGRCRYCNTPIPGVWE